MNIFLTKNVLSNLDTINGIGIDWNGNDTVINEKNYSCNDEEKISFIYIDQEPFAKEFCKTAPLVNYQNSFINKYLIF